MNWKHRIGAALAFVLCWSAVAHAEEPLYDSPSKGNQYVASMATQLYVVWSLPRNLTQLAHLRTRARLEAFMARTAIHLCLTHAVKNTKKAPKCTVHVLRLATNDEYNKSASGSWSTVGKMSLLLSALGKPAIEDYVKLSDKELLALFGKFELQEEQLDLPQKTSKEWLSGAK